MHSALFLLSMVLAAPTPPDRGDVGTFVQALRLLQVHGTPEALDPHNDQRLKGVLFKALGKDGIVKHSELERFMSDRTFRTLAGSDSELDPAEIRKAVEVTVPESRMRLFPRLRAHADFLTTSFDRIDEPHRQAGDRLVEWIASNHRPGTPLHVIVVCTGNSRRSLLGASMGNLAAAYHGLPEVRFHSGGTAPTAFNSRTVAALQAIGFEIAPTGEMAERGEPQTPNPIHRVRWGAADDGKPALDCLEFSKVYGDPSNPQSGFAALMVCGEADVGCPVVKGATLRVSMPYLDPKVWDDTAYEAEKYAERRDDLGRLMLSVLMRARARQVTAGTSAP